MWWALSQVDELGEGEEDGQRELILTGGAKNALVAVQRYYSNNVTDYERQSAMDLFLGIFIPKRGDKPGAWEQIFNSAEEAGPEGQHELVLRDKTLEQVIKVRKRPGLCWSAWGHRQIALIIICTMVISKLPQEVEKEEVNPAQACSELRMFRCVVEAKTSNFSHDAFDANKLSSFDKMTQYEFDGKEEKGLQ